MSASTETTSLPVCPECGHAKWTHNPQWRLNYDAGCGTVNCECPRNYPNDNLGSK